MIDGKVLENQFLVLLLQDMSQVLVGEQQALSQEAILVLQELKLQPRNKLMMLIMSNLSMMLGRDIQLRYLIKSIWMTKTDKPNNYITLLRIEWMAGEDKSDKKK